MINFVQEAYLKQNHLKELEESSYLWFDFH